MSTSVLSGMLAQSSSAAPFSARASVAPSEQYLGDFLGTVFTITVENTSTTDSIGAVEIDRPGKAWTIFACPSAPPGWSAQRSDTMCRYRSGPPTSDDIAPGASAEFQVRATTPPGTQNLTGSWTVSVSKSSNFDKPSKLIAAAATPPGLGITAYSFQVLDVVVDPVTTTPGAACPASARSATAGSTDHTLVVCGRNRTTGTLTPTAAQSSLAGTFVADPGTFTSGPVAPTTTSRVLGSWSGVTITGSAGTSKTVLAKIGSASNRTSPVTTLTGYEATAPANIPPNAADDADTFSEDNAGTTVNVLANDSDANGDTLAITSVDTTGTDGHVTNNGTDVTYDPNGAFESLGDGETATDTFTYTVSDGNGGTDTATVTITITGANDPPVATDDAASVSESSTGSTVDVLANDTDADTDTLAVTGVDTTGTQGLVTNNGTDVIYDPNGAFESLGAGETATDTFTYDVSDGNGGTDTATVAITITGTSAPNSAPSATGDADTVSEDSTSSTVDVLGNDTDADADALAVTAIDTTGTTGLVTNNGTDVTYDPNGAFESLGAGETDTDTFTYTVSDGNGGTDTATVTITITGVNDAPVVAGPEVELLTYTENDAATVITATGTVTDVDSANFSTGTLTVDYSSGGQAEDRLEIRNQGTGAGQIGVSGSNVTYGGTTIGTFTGGAGTTPLVITLNANTTPAAAQALLRNITYRNVSEDPSTATRTARFLLTDGDGGTAAPATRQITVTAVNDAPNALDDIDTVSETSTGSTVDVLANDFDAEADTLAVTAVDTTGTSGLVTNNGTDVSYDPNGAFDSLNTGETDTDTFTYTVSDGNGGTDTATVTITITGVGGANNPPVATNDSDTVGEDSTGSVVDVLANDNDADADTLAVTAVDTTGTSGLVTNNGTDVSYDPNGAFESLGAGETATDTFTYTVSDGNGGNDSATVTISITGANDAPEITVEGSPLSYAENDPATVITPAGTVIDVDSTNFDTGTLTVDYSGGGQAEDRLEIRNQGTGVGQIGVSGSNVTYGGVTIGTFTGGTGTTPLVITLNSSATPAITQTLLRNVTYRDVSASPSTALRTVRFVLTDGDGGTSAPATRQISVAASANAPAVTTTAGSTSYTEGAAASTVDGGLTVTDLDSPNLVSATAQITGNYVNGQDVLSLTPPGGIVANFDTSTGTLSLTGTASLATYQTALRAVKYQNTSDAPSTLTRTVTFKVDDGGVESLGATKTVTVAAVNDAPAIEALEGGALPYTENAAATVITATGTVTDLDSANFDTGTFTVDYSAGGQAEDRLAIRNQGTGVGQIGVSGSTVTFAGVTIGAFTGGTGTTPLVVTLNASATPTATQALLRNITYRNVSENPSTATRTARFVLTDGDGGTSAPATRQITVASANDAPVVTTTAGSLAHSEGEPAEVLDAAVTVADVDSANLTGATVQITGNFASGEDVLAVTAQLGITGSFNAATGTLTLTGTTTVSNYQTVLRTVTYRDTSENPSTLTRTVTFTVTDGSLTSNGATRGIAVTAVDDAPAVTASGGGTPYTEQAAAIAVDPGLTATDIDGGANPTGATVTILAPVAGDTLQFSPLGSITGSFSAGVMTLSGSGTLAEYQAALRSVQFSSTSDNPGASRQIRFQISGPVASNQTTKTIAITEVNDAPVVVLDMAGPLSYTEQAGFVNLFGPASTVTDPDSATLATLQVRILVGLDPSLDSLRLNPAISGFSANYAAGILTITRVGGTPADFQNALRNVQFSNTDDDPDNRNDGTPDATDADRTFTVVVDDGAPGGTTAPLPRLASITPVNDAPSAPAVLPTTTGIRNTTLVAGTTTTEPSVTRTVNLIGSSTDPDSLESSIEVSPVTSVATTQGGRITLASDGDLRYEPPASGTLASDTYGYALTDGVTASTPITFTVNLTGAVWYVADQAPLPRDGTAARPFDTVAAALAAAPAGQPIHIRRSPGDGVLSGSIVLGTNDRLIGEGVALTNADIGSATAETLFPAGTKPVLTASGADVITLASGAQVAGLSINPDGAANGLFGTATAGVVLRSMDVTDTGVAATQPGIELTGSGNGLTFTAPVSLSTTQAGALSVTGAALAGTIASTGVSGSTSSPGVSLTNTTGSLTFTTLAITTSGQPGFVLNNADAIDVGGGTVAAANRPAVDATALDAGSDLTFTAVQSTNSTSDGVNLDGADTNWTFSAGAGSSISGAATVGFDVNNGVGVVSYAGTVAAGATGKAVDVTSRGGTTTFSGNISSTGGPGITVAGNTAGTTTFSGATKSLSTGANAAVALTNNTGATVAFNSGGLAITTTSGAGFSATSGGTVTVAGTGNTISTTTGTGVNIASTTIGAANLTFQAVSSNGAASGIALADTGSSGGLKVLGTGAADSGGTIQNTTGPGVSLLNTDQVSLNNVKLLGTDRSGVQGAGVTGFSLTNSTITNAGDSHADDDDSSVAFNDTTSQTANNVDGAVTITGNTLTNAFGAGIEIFQYAGTISDAVITGNTISSSFDPTQSKRSGIALNLFGSTTTVASLTKGNISNNTVTGFPSGDGISLQGANTASSTAPAGTYGTPGSATNIVTFTGNQVIGDTTNKINGFGIAASVTGRGQGNFSITNNGTAGSPIRNTLSSPIAIGLAGDTTAYFVVTGNQISANNQFSSAGIALGTDKNIQADLSTLTHPVARATISNNTIANTSGSGIRVLHRDSNGTANLRVENNTITNVINPGPGIRLENGSSGNVSYSSTMCASISGNNTQSGPADGFGDKNPGINLYKGSSSATTYVFGLTGLAPSPATNAQVESYVTGLNPLSATGAGFFAGKKVAVRTGNNYTSCTLPAGM